MNGDEQVKTVRIVIDAAKAKEGGAAVEAALKSIDDKIASLGDSVKGSVAGLKNAIVGLFSFDAIMTQIKGLIEAFDRLGSRSRVLGVSVEWMQAFEYAAAQSSVKLDTAGGALDKWARLVGEAELGSKGAIDTLNKLGVNILDVDKKVRPLSDTFVDAARKLDELSGTAKGNALGVQAMGKEYQRVAPMMGEVAKGSDALVAAASKAGAIVNREMVKIWEDLASSADKTMIKWRSFAGENFAESVKKGFDQVAAIVGTTFEELRKIVGALDEIWSRAKQFARDQVIKGIQGDILPGLDKRILDQEGVVRNRSLKLDSVTMSVRQTQTGAGLKLLAQTQADYDAEASRLAALRQLREFHQNRLLSTVAGEPDAPPAVTSAEFGRKPPNPDKPTVGETNPPVAGDGGADRLNKRLEALKAEAAAQTAMADAALKGAAAVAEQESRFKALKDALEVYGDQAKATDPKVQALAATFRKFNDEAAQGKAVTTFRLQTEDLGRQNNVLERRLELFNAAPEVVAREIGLLQARNEVEKTGARIGDEDFNRRAKALEQQELLNQKLADAQRAQELWLEPIKSGLQNVQSSAANMWEGILTNSKFSAQEFLQLFSQTLKRAAAELLALATIRPVINVAVEGLSSIGLVSPSTVRQLGYGPGSGGGSGLLGGFSLTGGGSAGSSGGGLGGLTLPSWLGGGQPLAFLNRPIFNSGYGAYNTASDVASLTNTAMPQGASPSGMGFLGGTTWGQGLGALGGLGMGAFQLATAKGNTAKTIGGIGSMVGAAVSLIPGIGQIAGPIISLASSLIPGLFGGEEYKWDPMAGANTRFTPGKKKPTIHSTEINGGESIGGRYGRTWSVIDELLRATGGTIDPARAWSGDIWNNQRDGYSSVALIGPNGQSRFLAGGEGDRSQDLDTLIASVFSANVKNGGLTGISDTLLKAVNNREPMDEQEVRDLLSLIDAYDKFGKVIPTAKSALEEIAKKFATMTETARLYGLALDPIAAEQKKVTKRYAQDFIDQFVDPLAVELRALDDERKDAIASAEYIRDHVAGVYVDINKITDSFLKKESELRDRAYNGAIESLDEAIKRLTPGGDLANLNGTATLSGLEATFRATAAQAFAGDQSAYERLAGEGTALSEYGNRYFAGSEGYNDIRDLVLDTFLQAQARLQPGASSTPPQSIQADPNAAANSQQFQQLMAAFQRSTQDNDNLRAEITRLTGLVTRLLGRAA